MGFRKINQNNTYTSSLDKTKDFFVAIRNIGTEMSPIWRDFKISWTNLFKTSTEWEIYFSGIYDEIAMLLTSNTTITNIIKGNAVTVQYSTDNGSTWTNYTTAVSLISGTIRWRVSDFGAFSDGTIIIISE